MDGLFILAGLLFLASPVMATIALVVAFDDKGLSRRLDARVRALEQAQAAAGTVGGPAPPAPPPPPIVEAPAEPAPIPPSPPPASVPSSPIPVQSSSPPEIGFEERFGTRW